MDGLGAVAETRTNTYMKDPPTIMTIGLETLGEIGFENKDKGMHEKDAEDSGIDRKKNEFTNNLGNIQQAR